MKKILIVEDEKAMARALSIKLGNSGYEVDISNNGKEGLAAIESKKYDLVLLDLVMPVMTGFDVLGELKKQRIEMPPILVLSNLGQVEDITKAKELGAINFSVKSSTSLLEIVDKVKKIIS